MRRRWPILAIAVPFVFGCTLTAAYPASASTSIMGPDGPVQPGGPISGMVPTSVGGTPPGLFTSPAGGATATLTPQTSGGSRTGPGTRGTVVTSTNWSGYAATGGPFTSVTSSWTEPTGNCSGRSDQYAAFWVGLDGYSSSTVEQTGSEVDCDGRTAEYYGWWEMYPGASVDYTNRVRPGDHFTATVTYLSGSKQFQLTLTDSSEPWTKTVTEALPGNTVAARSSAEVIAEAPCCTTNGGILPLTNFGTVNFTGSAATAANAASASLASFNPVEIEMSDVSVSSISAGGNFSVSYTGGFGNPFPFGGF
jgi:hypothetical protein